MGMFERAIKKRRTTINVFMLIFVLLIAILYFSTRNSTRNDVRQGTRKYDELSCIKYLENSGFKTDAQYVYTHGKHGDKYANLNIFEENKTTYVTYYVINETVNVSGIPIGDEGLYFFWDDRGFEGCRYDSLKKTYNLWFDHLVKCKDINMTMDIEEKDKYYLVGSEQVINGYVYRKLFIINKMFYPSISGIYNKFIKYEEKYGCGVII